jgi:hypothetical protein
MNAHVAGLDIGQTNDWSALILAERWADEKGWHFNIRHIARWLALPYPALVSEVGRVLSRQPLTDRTDLRVDATGVGKPVLDLLRQAHAEGSLPPYPREVVITGAEQPSEDGRTVPKRDLVAHLEVLLSQSRLHVAAGLTLANTLKAELRNFRAKMSPSGHATFEAGSGHDDLVLAVALAVWKPPSMPRDVERITQLNRDLRSARSLRTSTGYGGIGLASGRWPW